MNRVLSTDAERLSAEAVRVERMNIGIYIRTLKAHSPASARFQETILQGLREVRAPGLHFVVLSDSVPESYADTEQMSYVALARSSSADARRRRWKLVVGGAARRALRLIGRGAGQTYERLTKWLAHEPAYYEQLRKLDVRLIWNLGIDVLPAPVPYALVIWDVNYAIHSMFPEYSFTGNTYNFYGRDGLLLQGASYAVVGTEEGKREVQDLFGAYPAKIRVIPFPTPALPARPEGLEPPPAGPYVYYPARFWPHKNHVVLVRALRLLRERRGLALRCVFSGIDNGNLAYVLAEAERLGVRDQIEYLGNVSAERLADLYRNAAALAYCSLVGPDNFPPLEAMSVGCPVVAADVPGAREQYGDAALLFSRTDESDLADLLWQVMSDDALRKALVEKGLRRAKQWTPLDYAQAMVGVLDEFAGLARVWDGSAFEAKWA